MNTQASALLTRLLKKQNEQLIHSLCQEYGLSPEEMLRKYHTPTFYLPHLVPRDANIVVKDIKARTKTSTKKCRPPKENQDT